MTTPITLHGILAIDTDGCGSHHGDPDAQDQTSAKVDAHGKYVPANDPSGVRFLNADSDRFAVCPENLAGTFKVGDTATITHPKLGVHSFPIGDYGPRGKAGEFSLAAVQSMGVEILWTDEGPIPTLDGDEASDIPVTVVFSSRNP